MNEYNVNGGLPIGIDIAARAQGGAGATVEPLSVTANGTYTAPEGTAYSPVTVNVPPTPITQVGSTLYIGTEGTDNA